MIKRIIALSVLCILFFPVIGQEGLNSLYQKLENSKTDTGKVEALTDITIYLYRHNQFQKTISYADSAIAIGKKLDNSKYIVIPLSFKSSAYYDLGQREKAVMAAKEAMAVAEKCECPDEKGRSLITYADILNKDTRYDSSIIYYEKALEALEEGSIDKAHAYNNISIAYAEKGFYYKSLDYLLKALEFYREKEMEYAQATALNNLGEKYRQNDDHTNAIKYLKKSISISRNVGDTVQMGRAMGNLGLAYSEIHKNDSAFKYLNEALDVNKSINRLYGKTVAHSNLASFYSDTDQPDKAFPHLEKVLEYSQKLGVKRGLYYGNLGLGRAYYMKEQYDSALKYINKAKQVIQGSTDDGVKMGLYDGYHDIYKKLGQFDSSLFYYEKYVTIKDSLDDASRQSRIDELSMKFEAEQKEKENAVLRAENLKAQKESNYKTLIIWVSVVLVAGLIVMVVLQFRYNKSKSDLNERLLATNTKIAQKNEELKKLNEVKNRMLSIVGHDVKGPLSSISSLLKLINSGELTADQEKEFLQDLESETSKTSMLLENLLHWTKSQFDGLEVHLDERELKGAVDHIVSLYENPIRKKNIVIENTIDPNDKAVVDKQLLDLILRNLLSNAIKYVYEGGKIRFDCEKEDGKVRLKVTDNGMGMSQEKIDTLFAKSSSTLGANNEKGTGLGLVLTKDAVEQCGGSLKVESERGKGSTFILELPLPGNN
ncbi:tetratricopeptide repeat-containing sensor histidine kinase [Salibacter halophilus]|nr:tetratricopeptide repeat-containing sensor histidine kinase [Salibacter halophilus]